MLTQLQYDTPFLQKRNIVKSARYSSSRLDTALKIKFLPALDLNLACAII